MQYYLFFFAVTIDLAIMFASCLHSSVRTSRFVLCKRSDFLVNRNQKRDSLNSFNAICSL